jgi:hypothetical protein
VDVEAVAQRARIELGQQPFQTVKAFWAQPHDGYRVGDRDFARLDSQSQMIISSSY